MSYVKGIIQWVIYWDIWRSYSCGSSGGLVQGFIWLISLIGIIQMMGSLNESFIGVIWRGHSEGLFIPMKQTCLCSQFTVWLKYTVMFASFPIWGMIRSKGGRFTWRRVILLCRQVSCSYQTYLGILTSKLRSTAELPQELQKRHTMKQNWNWSTYNFALH